MNWAVVIGSIPYLILICLVIDGLLQDAKGDD